MENLFRPGKWFVLFCGVFVLLWAVLQYVSNVRLKEEATLIGTSIFSWYWPGDNWRSKATITGADVLEKGANDAVVKIRGQQTLTTFAPGTNINDNKGTTETVDCSATLFFYRMSEKNKDYWMLGKVEFP